jgi:O-antigen/teichoic acid export membrane protein
MGYKKDALRGVTWMGALRTATRGMSFVRTAIIARLLNPSQFGLFAIATLVLTLVETITETGINSFLVQEKQHIKYYINSAWIVSIARGVLITAVIIITAPLIASFFNSPDAYRLILLVSIVPFVRGFINPAIIIFTKELDFHKEFYYRSSIFFVESVISIILVLIYKSPEGLVWGLIGGAIHEVIVSQAFVRIRPAFIYHTELIKKIISRGKWLTAAGIFDYLFYNGDNIVVGRLLGNAALGIYDMTYRISLLPITEVAQVVSTVTFPVFTRFSDDKNRLKKAYSKVTLTIMAITIPVGLIIFFFPKEIILLILGDKWITAAPVLRILTVFGVIRSITNPSGAVFLSVKKQEYITIITFIGAVTLLIVIVPFVSYFGLIGAGLSAVVASLVQIPFLAYFLIKVFKKA